MDQQYDMSPEMAKIFEIKQKQRARAKEYFQKLLYNPYRPVNDGVPFDPALMRFNALNTYHHEIFRPGPSYYFKVFLYFTPLYLCYYLLVKSDERKENFIKSGLVKYEDRYGKFYF